MKKQLIIKYESYLSDAERSIAIEKDPDKMSVLATCIYCYKEILRDLKEPNQVTDERLRKQFEATYEPNMIHPDTDKFIEIAKNYANI